MNCTCAIPDSFNVRPSDLVNPRCPIHGVSQLRSDLASPDEIKSLIRESLTEIQLDPGHFAFVVKNSDIDQIVLNLLGRYIIERKR